MRPQDKWTENDVARILVNPFNAIEINPALAVPRPVSVPREQWIQANVRRIEEIGAEAWLNELLSVLEQKTG